MIISFDSIPFVIRLISRKGLKTHPFFASINWESVLRKDVRVPVIPRLEGPMDYTYFDRSLIRVSNHCGSRSCHSQYQRNRLVHHNTLRVRWNCNCEFSGRRSDRRLIIHTNTREPVRPPLNWTHAILVLNIVVNRLVANVRILCMSCHKCHKCHTVFFCLSYFVLCWFPLSTNLKHSNNSSSHQVQVQVQVQT